MSNLPLSSSLSPDASGSQAAISYPITSGIWDTDSQGELLITPTTAANMDVSNSSLPELLDGERDSFTNDSAWTFYDNRLGPFQIEYIRIVFILLYTAVFVLCVVGNLLVIYVVLRHRKMRTTTNFFLGNLAVADLCVGIFCIIPNLLLYMSPYWYLGRVMCKLLYFVQMMAYAASITILTVISVERYFAILHPLRCKTWKRLWLLRVAVLIIWTASAMTGIPHLVLRDAVSTSGLSFCIVVDLTFNRQAYVTANFLIWYVVPLCLMSLMYFKISVVLWNTSKLDRLSTNALHHWRQQKKVKYTYTVNNGREQHPRDPPYTTSGPQISIEDHYPERSSSSGGSSGEAREPPVSDVTSATTWRTSRCSTTVALNGDPCSDLLSVQTGSVEVSPDEDAVNSMLLAHKDLVPPRKGSNANPNKLSPISPDVNNAISQYLPKPEDKDTSNSTKLTNTDGKGDSKQLMANSASRKVGTERNEKVRSNWHKITKQVHKSSTGQWPVQRAETALLARRRVIRLLMIIIGCFAVCVLPYHIQMLVNEFVHTKPSFLKEIMNPITFLIFYSNSALNPILYAFLSDNFRKSLCELLRNQTCRRRRPSYSQPQTNAASKPMATPNRQPANLKNLVV